MLVDVTPPGCKYSFKVRLPSSDTLVCLQIFSQQEYAFSTKKIPQIIVDAGANIGCASIYFANKYPKCKILAIEPETENFELLKKNVAPYSNVIPIQAALWGENSSVDLVDPGIGSWGFMTQTGGGTLNTISGFTVERLMCDYGLEHIDILKIDIEGAENEVFQDTSSWLEKIDSLVIELHERMKPGCNRSFYNGSNGFDYEWQQGENIFLSRTGCLEMPGNKQHSK